MPFEGLDDLSSSTPKVGNTSFSTAFHPDQEFQVSWRSFCEAGHLVISSQEGTPSKQYTRPGGRLLSSLHWALDFSVLLRDANLAYLPFDVLRPSLGVDQLCVWRQLPAPGTGASCNINKIHETGGARRSWLLWVSPEVVWKSIDHRAEDGTDDGWQVRQSRHEGSQWRRASQCRDNTLDGHVGGSNPRISNVVV